MGCYEHGPGLRDSTGEAHGFRVLPPNLLLLAAPNPLPQTHSTPPTGKASAAALVLLPLEKTCWRVEAIVFTAVPVCFSRNSRLGGERLSLNTMVRADGDDDNRGHCFGAPEVASQRSYLASPLHFYSLP
jgi:hypothetical protein